MKVGQQFFSPIEVNLVFIFRLKKADWSALTFLWIEFENFARLELAGEFQPRMKKEGECGHVNACVRVHV